jgi:hypothetical protein
MPEKINPSILQEYVVTANSGKYKNWDEINSKFPELKGYDPVLLQEYVVTANSGKYKDWDEINSKFKEFDFGETLKKKEPTGGLPFQKTSANAPQFFGTPSVPTSTFPLKGEKPTGKLEFTQEQKELIRPDGTKKGTTGFLGKLKMQDGSGKDASEMSIGIEIDGKQTLIPTLVPTLTENEKTWLLKGGNVLNKKDKTANQIVDKAIQFAQSRKSEGKPFFFDEKIDAPKLTTAEIQKRIVEKNIPIKGGMDMPVAATKAAKEVEELGKKLPNVGREQMYTRALDKNANKLRKAQEQFENYKPILDKVETAIAQGIELTPEEQDAYNAILPEVERIQKEYDEAADKVEYFTQALKGNRTLKALDTDAGFKERFINQGMDNFGSLFANSLAGVARIVKGGLPPHLAVQAELAQKISQRQGDRLKARAEYTTSLMDEKDNYVGKEVGDIYKEKGLVGATEYALKKFTESLPVTLGIMGAAATGTGGAVLANTALFGGSANQRYEELKDRTDMTEEQKIANAVGYGGSELLFEGVLSSGMGVVYKQMIKTMGKEAAEKAIKKNVIDVVTNGVKKYMPLSGAIVEGLGEGATQLTQNIIDKYTDPTQKDKNLMDGVANATAVGFAGGAAISSPTVITYINRGKNVERNKEIEKERKAIDNELTKDVSQETSDVLEATDNMLMQEQNDLSVEDMNILQNNMTEEQRETVKVLANEREKIQDAINETESEEVKKLLEKNIEQINAEIDKIYDLAPPPPTKEGYGETRNKPEGQEDRGVDGAVEVSPSMGVPAEEGVTEAGVPTEEVAPASKEQTPEVKVEGSLRDVELSMRRPDKNEIVFVSVDALLEKHAKDQPSYDIQKPENRIKGRVEKAKEYIKNYIKDQRAIDPKTGERMKTKVSFEPSVVDIGNDGKISFEDGRHRVLAAKQLGLTEVPIEVPREKVKSVESLLSKEQAPPTREGVSEGVNEGASEVSEAAVVPIAQAIVASRDARRGYSKVGEKAPFGYGKNKAERESNKALEGVDKESDEFKRVEEVAKELDTLTNDLVERGLAETDCVIEIRI